MAGRDKESSSGTPSGSNKERAGSTSGGSSRDEAFAARLADPNVEIGLKLRSAQDVRDEVSRDGYQGSVEYIRFIEVLLPVILKVLNDGPALQWTCSAEIRTRLQQEPAQQRHPHGTECLQNSLRFLLLETLHRLGHHEPLRSHVGALMQLMLKIMEEDNEEHAILALKIIIDLHRNYKETIDSTAQAFLDLVKQVYQNMGEVIQKTFGDENGAGAMNENGEDDSSGSSSESSPPKDGAGTPGGGQTPGSAGPLSAKSIAQMQAQGDPLAIRKLPLGMKSLKLLAECPIAVVFLFQTYREIMPKELPIFVPLIFQFLELQAGPQAKAHHDAAMRGETFIGITPVLHARRAQFTDLIISEVKTMSFVAYFLRMSAPTLQSYRPAIPSLVVRLLKDCPAEGASHRKELLIAARHILQTDFRNAFVPHIDTLVDDRVLIGIGITCHEQLRPLAYSMIADLVHHVREDLSITTLAHVVHIYSCNLHDPTLAPSIQTMCSKLLLNLTENVVKTETEDATHILYRSLETFVKKIENLAESRDDWKRWSRPPGETAKEMRARLRKTEAPKPSPSNGPDDGEQKMIEPEASTSAAGQTDVDMERVETTEAPAPDAPDDGDGDLDEVDVERAKPIAQNSAMTDTTTDLLRDTRFLLRNLIFALKTTIHGLRHVRAALPGTDTMGRLFRGVTKCMAIFDTRNDGGKEHREVMDGFCAILLAVEQLVFLEVVETNMPFFLEELLQNQELLAIPQTLLAEHPVSQIFVGISFRFLVTKLDKLGQGDAELDSIILRLFKMSFMAVTIFPEHNEVVLQPHLAHIIMHSLKLAGKAPEPGCYYLLLRVLFRSIGGGRFEILYKEVIPLLEVLLTSLNNLLNAATERTKRDLFVELCLTVPVRLSVLLPYLSYLMKPLVLSLQAGADLVSQGLRTLELCVDNLTPEFLNPLMAPVQQEINAALWKLLRPLPFNHHHAHTTVRILGKIGGRNRKQLGPPLLGWKNVTDEATASLSFDGKTKDMPIGAIVELALRMIRRGDLHYRRNAYAVLKHASATFLKDSLALGEQEALCSDTFRGLFEACRIDEFQQDAIAYLRGLSRHIFTSEVMRKVPEDSSTKLSFPFSSALLDGMIDSLANAQPADQTRLANQFAEILQDLVNFCREQESLPHDDQPANLLYQFALRLGSLCYDHSWQRKSGGAVGIDLLVRKVTLSPVWLIQHEGEFIRALLFMLKDMPADPPGNIDSVVETILYILNQSNLPEHKEEFGTDRERAQKYLVGFLVVELSSQIETVRTTAQKALKVLADLNEVTLTELITPVKLRLLNPIFTKPLRALAFPMQIGHMDAITFCMTLEPPLLELENEKDRPEGAPPKEMEVSLGRLLTEALGIADADDGALTGGKPSHHANSTQLTQLRVVCVKLLSAAMSSSDFLAPRHTNMRNKILQVYFKLLYAKSSQVVEAAYECLKVPVQQGKLPKDLLQSGLRPVLVNLGDHKRLTVDSLQGLARLLELLPNYFKVEIGGKLLDHFKALSEPNALAMAALAPQSESGEIKVMAAIVNVFHLLPHPGAGNFLQDLCAVTVDVERRLHKTTVSPFTKPLALYVNRYVPESCLLFASQIRDEAWSTTFDALLASEHALAFRDYVADNASMFFAPCFAEEAVGTLATLNASKAIWQICQVKENWIVSNDEIVNRLVSRWTSNIRKQRLIAEGEQHVAQIREDQVFLQIFKTYLEGCQTPLGIDLLFRITDVFSYRSPSDPTDLACFLFRHVALSHNINLRQSILRRFIDFFSNDGISAAHKTMALRYLINPLLTVALNRGESESAIADAEYINLLHSRIWQPWLNDDVTAGVLDDSLRIEGFHMATLIVKHRWQVMQDCKKDVIKLGWSYIKTPDTTTKTAAHCLIAQFLSVFDSKPKILMPIWSTLLRSHQVEARGLVKEALNVLTPELPRRCGGLEGGVHPWIRATRHIMVEDSHSSMSQLTHVYSLLIKFPNVFYERRDLFMSNMVASLPKLSLLSTATPETRALSIDLIELIMNWDKKRMAIAKEEESAKMDVDNAGEEEGARTHASPKRLASIAPSTTSQSSGYQTFTVPLATRDSIVNNTLIRFIASNPEPVSRGGLVKRSLDLLRQLFELWPDVNIKYAFIQRVLSETDISEQHLPMLSNTVDILNTVLSLKSDDWVREHLSSLQRVTERGYAQQDARLHLAFKPVLRRILSVVPSAAEREKADQESYKALEEWATNAINDGLRQMTNLNSTVTMMEAWAAAKSDSVNTFIGPLVKVITTLVKEHINTAAPTPSHEQHLRLLRICFELCRNRMGHTGEGRRWVLNALCTLVEKSSSSEWCRYILDIASQWVLTDHREAFPTNKEKATLLGKMMVFENRPDETLLRDYLQVILKVYSDPQLARSEYTVRLEQPFLLGCRNRDPSLRCRFMQVFDEAIVRSLNGRLNYIFGIQNWESLADSNWMHQALDLLLGAVNQDTVLMPNSHLAENPHTQAFVQELKSLKSGGFSDAARKLLYSDSEATHAVWVSFFAHSWSCLSRTQQIETTRFLIGLLTKEYHLQNVDRRPNVVQTLLAGALRCSPPIALPPHLVRYLGKTYNAYHTAIELLQYTVEEHRDDDTIRDSSIDALAETYAELAEEDFMYGLWRRRAFFAETNISISFEQGGLWSQAQQMYESAQLKARSGSLPFTESEYSLWEDHWVICAGKLQQWDILTDLAKQEGNNDLLMECAWRLSDWAADSQAIQDAIKNMIPVPTPRKRVFESLMFLVRTQMGEQLSGQDFQRLCDEGIQYSLRKWYHLPEIVSEAHIPLLAVFQQFVELQEAAKHVFVSLATTDANNLDARSAEMKLTLQAWRDRLPNLWDDVNIWSDLVAWRQHIFQAINRAYLPLLPNKDGTGGASTNSHAYRGYHETAWIINRFAHVARKHHLTDVCFSSLTKIYTLPNIEIQEAFLKLREQAKCHYQSPNELPQGLEVINNTNLAYFNLAQKSEFYTLKGMFLARLGMNVEANEVFTQAVTMDMSFPKVWAEYGRYHDRLFKADPNDLGRATNAVACYLQAAGLYKSGKVRKILGRILWLLSLDDNAGTVSKAFDSYTGDLPVWYWITFAPQLIAALGQKEARYARIILLQIAKKYPQGLFFHLRTAKEDLDATAKQTADLEATKNRAARNSANATQPRSAGPASTTQDSAPYKEAAPASAQDGDSSIKMETDGPQGESKEEDSQASKAEADAATAQNHLPPRKTALEYVEEIASVLKTAFPLLALSVELVCDQIAARFKAMHDEDIFRLITALLQDGIQQHINRAPNPEDHGLLPKNTIHNITRFANNLPAALKDQFHRDFISTEPNLAQYVQRLQAWRDRYDRILDKKPKRHPLETMSHWLVEYKYQTFDEIEVPGQYLKHDDNNRYFVKISYFAPKVEIGRLAGAFTRRLTMIGYDGSHHTFAVQIPTLRGARREEKLSQLFRMLNGPLQNRVESRKRGLQFYLPAIVPIGHHCRLIESNSSIISLQDIHERHCTEVKMHKDDPIMAYTEKYRELILAGRQTPGFTALSAKLEAFIEIATKIFPDTILRDYFLRSTSSASDLWHTRKQFMLHMAAFIFQTYIFSIGRRAPVNLLINRAGGQMYTTDFVPMHNTNSPEFSNGETVPFRLTPNIQTFLTPIGIEGTLATGVMSIARSLTESEYDLEHRLAVFVADEVSWWYTRPKAPQPTETSLRNRTMENVDLVLRRATLLSCKMDREKLPIGATPVNQTVLGLISHATNPLRLAAMDVNALPWL